MGKKLKPGMRIEITHTGLQINSEWVEPGTRGTVMEMEPESSGLTYTKVFPLVLLDYWDEVHRLEPRVFRVLEELEHIAEMAPNWRTRA